MRILLLSLAVLANVWAADQAKVAGNVKLYNINTLKQGSSSSDASALSVGGQLGITSSDWHGLYGHVNFMTTNGLFLMSDPSQIDGSNLGNDIAQVSGNPIDKGTSFSILSESYAGYTRGGYDLKIGRQKIDTPLAAQKEVRLLPSTFSGAVTQYKNEDFTLGIAYLDAFKQRTSNQFYNILEHALGANTVTNTGKSLGEIIVTHASIGKSFSFYNYQINDFINSSYAEAKTALLGCDIAVQGIYQTSVGYFDTALKNGTAKDAKNTALNYSDGLSALSVGLKVVKKVDAHQLTVASTYTRNSNTAYSNITAPFDGTPLYTDTITGNDLFQSLYGQALKADSGYKAGVLGLKAAYSYALTQALKVTVAVARFDNASVASQIDINTVISYKLKGWSLDAKGIWVFDNNQVAADQLQQYRLIANYPF